MASAGVVGQHRLDSDMQLFPFKLHGVRKRSSREKMLARGSVPAERQSGSRVSPGPAGDTAASGGAMPGVPAAPRSPDRDGEEGSADGGRNAGIQVSPTGRVSGDRNCNADCDANRNSGSRRGSSFKRSCVSAMPGEAVAGGHRGAHRHRDAPRGDGGCLGAPSAPPDSGGLPLERLTQGRTGVVKLARAEPSRREAWSIFPQGSDHRVNSERGEGHRFEAKKVLQDWCDVCRSQIDAQALKCQNCSYTCHLECESQVQLDCNQRDRKQEETPSPRSHFSSTVNQRKQNETKEEEEGGTKDLSEEEVRTRIEEYNTQVSENGMTLASDGSFTGFIKVHLLLSRPVTVLGQASGSNRPLLGDQDGTERGQCERGTSFYLPSDCVKQLHISSLTTASEVIQGLLKKFMVLDNPRKFALYRQTHRDGQDLFQKLPLCEHPLLLRLIAGPDPEQLSFVLKENETGEVEWHRFSVPELQNFLAILEKEEAERVKAVEQKYTMYRRKLQQALQQHDP